MSISEREQQALDSIEGDLASSGPELAAKLAMFTRLTAGEALPAGETAGEALPAGGNIRAGRLCSGLRWPSAWGMVWVITSVALIVVALAVGHAGGKGTCPVRAAACAGQLAGHISW